MTTYSKLERNRYTDTGDALECTKLLDDIIGWSHNWRDDLASGETVASAAYVDSGTTRTSVALVSPVTSCNVAGIGEFEVTITTSTGRKYQRVFRFVEPNSQIESRDYGN